MTAINQSSDLVVPEQFYKSMIPLVSDLHCGNDDFGNEATEWIHGLGEKSVRNVLNKQGRVWLYRNTKAELVGFGALMTTEWEIDGVSTVLQYIPMLAVFYDFQGLPFTAPKYCYQIIDHLIDEAEKNGGRFPLLGLAVHPENAKAIHIYEEKVGFQWVKNEDGFSRMIMGLTG